MRPLHENPETACANMLLLHFVCISYCERSEQQLPIRLLGQLGRILWNCECACGKIYMTLNGSTDPSLHNCKQNKKALLQRGIL